jgi:hypothetical protein
MKTLLIILTGLLTITFTNCIKKEDPPIIITTSDCNCDDPVSFMTVVVSSAPTNAFIRLSDGAYGANNFFMYELTKTTEGYIYTSNGKAIETKIPTKDWVVPPYIWSAGRAKTDGKDPFAPTASAYFEYGILPMEGWTKSGNAPALKADQYYMARMVMGYSINDNFNIVTHCYQRVFQFKRGVYGI